jgi:hypothetical protein
LTKIILDLKYLFIYTRFKLKLVKGQLARDKIPLVTYSVPFSPILLLLKISIEKIQKQNNCLKIISSKKKVLKIFIRKLNRLFSFSVGT